MLKIGEDVLLDCAFDACRVHCRDPLQIPSFAELRCNELKKNYMPVRSADKVECSPDPGVGVDGVPNRLFSTCGALTRFFDEVDIENLDIKCHKNICEIKAREPEKYTPNVEKLTCINGFRFNVDESIKKIKAYREFLNCFVRAIICL